MFRSKNFYGFTDNYLDIYRYDLLTKSLNVLEDCYFSLVDATGKIIFISTDFEKVDGFKVDDILGKNVLDVYKLGREHSVHMRALDERQVLRNTKLNYLSSSGQNINLVMDIYPVFSGTDLAGSFAISRDTAKIQALTDKLLDLQKALYQQSQKTTPQ